MSCRSWLFVVTCLVGCQHDVSTIELQGVAGQPLLLEVANEPALTQATHYRWDLAEAPAGVEPTPLMNAARITVTPGRRGAYLYLRWLDSDLSDELTHQFVLSIEGTPPTSQITSESLSSVGTTIVLSGTGSSSIEQRSLSYRWRLVTRPETSTSTLSALDTDTTNLVPDVPGTYVVTLDVFDGELWSATSMKSVDARP